MEVNPAQGLLADFISRLGRGASWLTLAMVVLTFAVVVMRYGFNLGWIWLQESVTWLHATVFMVAAAWAVQTDDHVRVDIFYRDRPVRHKAWVNLVGTLVCIVPFSLFMLLMGWDYVASSWGTLESSREAGGLPGIFLLKSLMLVLPALLLLQSVVSVRSGLRQLRND